MVCLNKIKRFLHLILFEIKNPLNRTFSYTSLCKSRSRRHLSSLNIAYGEIGRYTRGTLRQITALTLQSLRRCLRICPYAIFSHELFQQDELKYFFSVAGKQSYTTLVRVLWIILSNF